MAPVCGVAVKARYDGRLDVVTEDESRAVALAMIPGGSAPLTLSELENHLGAAADLLRGSIGHADFKGVHLSANVL